MYYIVSCERVQSRPSIIFDMCVSYFYHSFLEPMSVAIVAIGCNGRLLTNTLFFHFSHEYSQLSERVRILGPFVLVTHVTHLYKSYVLRT